MPIGANRSSTHRSFAGIGSTETEFVRTVEGAVQGATKSFENFEVQCYDKKLNSEFPPHLGWPDF